jgi:predicted permease
MLSSLSLRRAARGLLRRPGISVLAVLALGFGVGLPTAVFSLVDAAVLRGLPIPEPGRLMHLERRRVGTSGEGFGAAPRDYLEWSAQQRSFESLGAFRAATVTVRGTDGADRWRAAYLTPNAFRILGVAPARGRAFGAADAPAALQSSVVLSDRVWRERYGADPGLVGRTLWVDGAARTVVGVMPAGFRFPTDEDVWIPLVLPAGAATAPNAEPLDVFGLLRPGTSRAQARAEFATVARRMAQAYPETNRDLEVTVKPFTERFVGETPTATMYVMLGTVLLVLALACTNVASLLLVRAVHRAREVVVGVALGASRARVVGDVLLESAILAAAGGALGVGVAWGGITLLARAFAGRLPYWAEPRLDATVTLFAVALGAAAALLAGVLPALRTTRADPAGVLRDDSRGATGVRVGRVMQSLVVLELALSMALLVTSALLTRSVVNSARVDLGFPARDLFTARVAATDGAARARFYDELERRVRAVPGVAEAGLASDLPGTHTPLRRVPLEGAVYRARDEMPVAHLASVSAALFPALGVAPVAGRTFGPQDRADGAPVAVVNARFVQRYLHGGDAVGRRIRVGPDSAAWRTIVGVVPDLWMGAFDSSPDRNPAGVYVPLAQSAPEAVAVAARVRGGDPLAITGAVRAAVFAVDRDAPIFDVRAMPQVVTDGTWFYGLGAGLVGVCGVTALLLAAVGVYGVVAFSVGQRRREFGIRVALGAQGVSIVGLVLRRGAGQLALGLGGGALLAAALARGVESLLFEVSPSDPAVFAGIALGLAAIAGAAMLVPASSAARGEPLETLRPQ